LEGNVTLPSFSLPTVMHDISYLLVVPAMKHPMFLAGGLTLLSLAAFSERIRGVFSETTQRPRAIRPGLLRGGYEYRNQTDLRFELLPPSSSKVCL
jgi:hypothetical protein